MTSKKEESVVKVGKVFRSKGGELMKVEEYKAKGHFVFRMLDPITTEETEFTLEGASKELPGFFADVEAKEIDLTTYKPTGLVPDAYKRTS